MPDAFKLVFNQDLIDSLSSHLHQQFPEFDPAAFVAMAAHDLDSLELKQRSQQITQALLEHLPQDSDLCRKGIVAALHPDQEPEELITPINDDGIRGWAIMPLADAVVARMGDDEVEETLDCLAQLTCRFSAEFAIRPVIAAHPERAMAIMSSWCQSPNRHIRRLASEGCRTRLPWGLQLKILMQKPEWVWPILEALIDDPEEYVRRSVANNLNDISKDNPDWMIERVQSWLPEADKRRKALLKHACRGLIKQGDKRILSAFGFGAVDVSLENLTIATPTVVLGQALTFQVQLKSNEVQTRELLLDFVIYHKKADGSLKPKVFKWKQVSIAPEQVITLEKRHPMKKITTRVYYPGEHQIALQINGVELERFGFELEL